MTEPLPCPHRTYSGTPCAGRLLAGGHCDGCGRHRDAQPLPEPDNGPARPLVLPVLPAEDARSSVIPEDAPLAFGKRCGNAACGAVLGPPLVLPPVPNEGHCPACGSRYSFVPRLRKGDVLGQYRVLGCLAHGGQGWIHLAVNTRLDDMEVAVKELLNRHDEALARLAEDERRYLIALDHPDIVRILDYLREPEERVEQAEQSGKPVNYIVMEYVGSTTLEKIVTEVRRGRRRLDIEEVITYGCRILAALGHLHNRKDPDTGPLAYCDMKPSNVIHYKDGIKVIDLGGVRPLGVRTAPALTDDYASPEIHRTGPSVAHDLYSVGRSLEELARFAATGGIPGTGITSFRHAVHRATAAEAGERFASATEMAEQLRGVQREIRGLRGKPDRPEPSNLFEPTRLLLDAELGALPPLSRWLERRVPRRGEQPVSDTLNADPPPASDAARALPVPEPHPDDPQRKLFRLSTYDPSQRLYQPPDGDSGEICFHNLRMLLTLPDGPALDDAAAELDEAERILAGSPQRAWQLAWYEGLLALMRADAADQGSTAELTALSGAYDHYQAVFRQLPGEYAPKLALAYCAERLAAIGRHAGRPDLTREDLHRTASDHYLAVWSRNRQQGSGAFGLARLALARGSRWDAVADLDNMPWDSPDHASAWIAALRIRAARLGTAPDDPLPALREIGAARRRLSEAADPEGAPVLLAREHGLLLEAELLEWALDRVTAVPQEGPPGTDFPYDELFGEPYAPRRSERTRTDGRAARLLGTKDTPERAIRLLLATCYRELSRHFRDSDREQLIELYNSVRPTTLV